MHILHIAYDMQILLAVTLVVVSATCDVFIVIVDNLVLVCYHFHLVLYPQMLSQVVTVP